MPEDVKTNPESSAGEDDAKKSEESLEHSEAASDKAEGDKSEKYIPYSRFREINEAKKQSDLVVNWYRENIGDPDDVIAFRKWKAEQVEKAKEDEDKGKISPQKLAEIRKVMREADPEYAEMVERHKREQEAKIDAQFDDAEDIVRELAEKEYGLKSKADEPEISWLAQQVMLAVKNDEKLSRLWNAGSTDRCIRRAFTLVQERQEKLGKTISKMRQDAADKRKVNKLPTLPSAPGSLTSKSDKDREKGITKKTHDDAWEILQQSLAE